MHFATETSSDMGLSGVGAARSLDSSSTVQLSVSATMQTASEMASSRTEFCKSMHTGGTTKMVNLFAVRYRKIFAFPLFVNLYL